MPFIKWFLINMGRKMLINWVQVYKFLFLFFGVDILPTELQNIPQNDKTNWLKDSSWPYWLGYPNVSFHLRSLESILSLSLSLTTAHLKKSSWKMFLQVIFILHNESILSLFLCVSVTLSWAHNTVDSTNN